MVSMATVITNETIDETIAGMSRALEDIAP
jgi:hypothetical protein